MKNKIFVSAVIAGIIVLNVIGFRVLADLVSTNVGLINGGSNASSCKFISQTRVAVGKDISTQILGSSSRAWAMIQSDTNATTTFFLFLGNPSPATTSSSALALNATTTPSITFGLNTDNPWTGAVGGVSPAGTSTVLVTECRYY